MLAVVLTLSAILVMWSPYARSLDHFFFSQATPPSSAVAALPATVAPKNTQVPTAMPTSAPTPGPTPRPTRTPSSEPNGGERTSVEITFYGSYDNDPPGSTEIAHPVLHQQAGGTGTYSDPLTFASPAGNGAYSWGTRIYVPLVQKYFIREDECAVSWTAPDGCGSVTHVDLYMGNPSSSRAVVACEDALTPNGNGAIIINPPSNLPYDATPLWNQSTGRCLAPHT